MNIIILVILLFSSNNLSFQDDPHKILYEVKVWRLDYSFYVDKKDTVYVIDKPHSKKDYNKVRASELNEAAMYIVFDSSNSKKIEYKKNFIMVFDEKKRIAVDKLIDSTFVYASSDYNIDNHQNAIFVENYIDIEYNKSYVYNYFNKIIVLNNETLVLLKEGGYIEVYTNNRIEKGESKIEKDDYFIIDVLVNYFESKNIPYKIEDNKIISDALEKIDKN